MIGSGLSPRRIAGQVTHRYAEPLSEPTDRNHRSSPNVVGYESQPRQRAQLHGCAQNVCWTAKLAYECLVCLGQCEVADQLRTSDLWETPKTGQLLLGEHIASCHPNSPPRTSTVKTSAY